MARLQNGSSISENLTGDKMDNEFPIYRTPRPEDHSMRRCKIEEIEAIDDGPEYSFQNTKKSKGDKRRDRAERRAKGWI